MGWQGVAHPLSQRHVKTETLHLYLFTLSHLPLITHVLFDTVLKGGKSALPYLKCLLLSRWLSHNWQAD